MSLNYSCNYYVLTTTYLKENNFLTLQKEVEQLSQQLLQANIPTGSPPKKLHYTLDFPLASSDKIETKDRQI